MAVGDHVLSEQCCRKYISIDFRLNFILLPLASLYKSRKIDFQTAVGNEKRLFKQSLLEKPF